MALAIGEVLSVNLAARPGRTGYGEPTGIGKIPAAGPVRVAAPGPRGVGGSGLAGDTVCNLVHHGGDDQAVYAYAREDVAWWERELGRELPAGLFGENLTVRGLDLAGALVGERWRVGDGLLLQVAAPRVPCRKFADAVGQPHWVHRFTERGRTGAYLRVLEPGEVRAGDPVAVESRPGHGVTLEFFFRASTTHGGRLAEVLEAGDGLSAWQRARIEQRLADRRAGSGE